MRQHRGAADENKMRTGPVALGDGPAWFVLWESRATSGFVRLARPQNAADQFPLTSVRALAPLRLVVATSAVVVSVASVPATAATEFRSQPWSVETNL